MLFYANLIVPDNDLTWVNQKEKEKKKKKESSDAAVCVGKSEFV